MKNSSQLTNILFFFFLIISLSIQAQSFDFNLDTFKITRELLKTNPDSTYKTLEKFSDKPYLYNYLKGIYYKQKKDYELSNSHLLSSIKENKDNTNPLFLDAFYYIGYNYQHLGLLDSADYYFFKIIKLEKQFDNKAITPKALGSHGIVCRQKNKIDSAIYYINLANIEYQKQKDTLQLAIIQNTLGNIYQTFDVKLSIKHYTTALDLFQNLGLKKETAITEQNLGTIFTNQGKYEIALDYLKKAYQFFIDEDYLQYQIISLNNIGFTYLNLENYPKAEEHLLKAIEINTKYKNALAFSHLNLGTCYNLQQLYSKAETHLKKALSIAKENKLEYLMTEIYDNLVLLSAMQSNHSNFTKYFNLYKNLQKDIYDKDVADALAKYGNELETIETKNLLLIASKDKEIQQKELEKNKSELFIKNILLSFGLIVIILLIIMVFIIAKTNKKQKALQIIIEKRNAIIEKHNLDLEDIIKERTKELVIAKKKAEESDLLKSKFLANISHEIRTPLNSIMGFSDILCEGNTDPENIVRFSKIIRNNGSDLLNIIEDIIDVSKIESNAFNFDLQTIHLSEIIYSVENESMDKAKLFNKESKITLTTCFSEKDVLVKVDPYKLNIVFNKLINNAFQFTEEGFINIGSEIRNNKIYFYISDSGIGIPEEHLPKILEDFRKFHKDKHIQYRGLGIGLYITHHILLKMNSVLQIESTDGKGSTFSFELDIVNEA